MTKPIAGSRVTFSPAEFATLFGKSQTWGYRQIYAGKVKTITEYGRILIPAAEVEKILASAGRYEGKKPDPPKTKGDFQEISSALQSAWGSFLRQRRRMKSPAKGNSKTKLGAVAGKWQGTPAVRKEALSRLGRKS